MQVFILDEDLHTDESLDKLSVYLLMSILALWINFQPSFIERMCG